LTRKTTTMTKGRVINRKKTVQKNENFEARAAKIRIRKWSHQTLMVEP